MEVRMIFRAKEWNWRKKNEVEVNCSCGKKETFLIENYDCYKEIKAKKPVCDACQTKHLVGENDKYFLYPLHKTKTSADLEIYEVFHKTGNKKKVVRIKFDLITHELWIEKNNEMILIESKTQANRMFAETIRKHISGYNRIRNLEMGERLGNENNKDFISEIFRYEGTCGEKLYQYVTSMPVQILANAGYDKWVSVLFLKEIVQSSGTTPHQILKIPKVVLPELKDWFMTKNTLKMFQELSKKFDPQDIKAGFEIAKNENYFFGEEDFKNLFKLAQEENYPSFQKLVRYLMIEAKHRQGIMSAREATNLLYDMIHMAKEMNVEYELMPKSLKLAHDVILMNYNVARTEKEQEKFKKVVEEDKYKKLEYKGQSFQIITPKSGDDLVREGRLLSHCVASYFERVMDKQSKIYFLRKNENPNTPLVTIEVCGDKIHQVSGRSNRKPNDEENRYIQEWAREKKLSNY